MEGTLEANELAHAVLDVIESKKANNILMLDMRDVTLLADYFILCDATSRRQINAIQDDLLKELKKSGSRQVTVEGTPESGWVLVDFGAVIAHIFSPDQRAYYRLEELWSNAPVVVRII